MKIANKAGNKHRIPATFVDLVMWHAPRPVHDEASLENTTEILDILAGRELTRDQQDYFELLCNAVEKYEQEHHPIERRKLKGRHALKFLLKENKMTPADLSRLLGVDRTLGYKLIQGERSLAKYAVILKKHFKVRAEIFIE